VTYRPADLHCDLRKSIEGVITTRLTDKHELQSLLTMCGVKDGRSDGAAVLSKLTVGEAALLPGIEEAGGKLQRFSVLPRLTPHIRHRTKYLDMPLSVGLGFVFTRNGKPVGLPARTLKEFVERVTSVPLEVLEGHVRRADFSRWVERVLQDNLLASDIRTAERQYQLGQISDLSKALIEPIQERYELLPTTLALTPAQHHQKRSQ